nr:MAG TPA: hypothetical protein [Caudoviricetes sp.]
MRTLFAAAFAAIALSACTPATIDDAIAKNLPRTCSLISTAHAAFIAISATGDIPIKTIVREAAAYDGIQTICADPSRVTASNALVIAAQAYVAIATALREAQTARR